MKGNSLSKLSRHVIKNEISNIGLKYSLTKNGTSAKAIAKFLTKEGNNWIGKIAAEYEASSIVSGVLNLFDF